jgi:hypothetical protein
MPVLDWTGKKAVVNHHREVRSAFLFIFVSVLTRAGFALGGPEDGTDRHSWKTYTNVRFQFASVIPPT